MDFTAMPHPSDFVYRGQGDTEFELVPSLYRKAKIESGRLSGTEIVEKMAEQYVRKQALLMPEDEKE